MTRTDVLVSIASSCVCTSPLAVMTIVGLHDFVKVSISASLKSFLLIMCIDDPESTTNSRSSGLRVDAGRHLFSEGEKNVALSCSFNFNTLFVSFHAASRTSCSCHSVSSRDRSSNFGALGLRSWGSPGQLYPSERFWSRILVWRATVFVHYTHWIGFRMFAHFRRINFCGVMSWNTQSNCRASNGRRCDDFCPWFNSWPVSRMTTGYHVPSCMQLMLLQHAYCTFVIILFEPSTRMLINLTMCIRALFSKSVTTLGLVTNILEGANFHKISCCKFLWNNPCKTIEHSTTGIFFWTSGSRGISLILLHDRIRRLFDSVICTAYWHGVGFSLPMISKNSLYTLFRFLILNHCVLLIISISGPKIPVS